MQHEQHKPKTLFLLLAIFFVSINLRPAITSVGPMIDPIREALSLTNAQVSLLTAIPVICMGIFATLAPILNRKWGLSNTVVLMLLVISVATALRGFVSGFGVLLGTAFIIGVAIAIIGPLLSAMIKQYFPTRAASVIGLYSFAMGIGAAISSGFTGVFYNATDSYAFSLAIWATFGVFGLIFWKIAMPTKMIVRQQEATEQTHIGRKSPWKEKKSWLFLFFFGMQASLFFSIITWFVPIATAEGMTLLQAGGLLSLLTTIQIALNIMIPLLLERFPGRSKWLYGMLTLGLIGIALFSTGIIPLMWVSTLFIAFPLAGLFPISLLFPLDETDTADEANSWTAMMQTGGYIIAGLLPFVIAFVYDITGKHTYTYIILAVMYAILLVLTYLIGDKKERVDK